VFSLKKILFAIDFSGVSSRAFGHALMLADRFRSQLTLLHVKSVLDKDVDPERVFPDIDADPGVLAHEIEKEFAALFALDGPKTLNVVRVVLTGESPAEEIARYAKEHDMDLIVMGTHGRTGLEHFLLGSVAEKVLQIAPCPVLTVRLREDVEVQPYLNIVVPIDFSEYSMKAFRYGVSLARQFEANLELLHVLDRPVQPEYYHEGEPPGRAKKDALRERSHEMLRKIVAEYDAGDVATETRVVAGRAYSAICKYAEKNQTDLIIMSTHGLSKLEHFFLGSTTEKVVRNAPCPVLTVKALTRDFVK